jgi:hypothetical protein
MLRQLRSWEPRQETRRGFLILSIFRVLFSRDFFRQHCGGLEEQRQSCCSAKPPPQALTCCAGTVEAQSPPKALFRKEIGVTRVPEETRRQEPPSVIPQERLVVGDGLVLLGLEIPLLFVSNRFHDKECSCEKDGNDVQAAEWCRHVARRSVGGGPGGIHGRKQACQQDALYESDENQVECLEQCGMDCALDNRPAIVFARPFVATLRLGERNHQRGNNVSTRSSGDAVKYGLKAVPKLLKKIADHLAIKIVR